MTRLLLLGDLILDEPDPDSFFEPSRELLRSADLVVGQVEVPHTARGVPSSVDIPAPPADPAHLEALPRAGIGVATLAGQPHLRLRARTESRTRSRRCASSGSRPPAPE